MKDVASIDDFAKLDLRVGTVTEAIRKEGSEKLIRLTVDFGEEKRTIFTALYPIYEPEFFVNKQFTFIYNLQPRKMMDEESQGMILATDTMPPRFLVPQEQVPNGTPIR